jgi:hypothetical protein
VNQEDYDIVVETEHLPIVLSILDAGAAARVRAEERRLGLSLVRIDQDEVGRLADELTVKVDKLDMPIRYRDPDRLDRPLDRILGSLRLVCANGYGGWSPAMGKNRTMSGVQFKPYPNAGGEDAPRPAPAPGRRPVERRTGRPVRVGVLDTPLYRHPVLDLRYVAEDAARLGDAEEPPWWWLAHSAFISSVVLDLAPQADLDIRTPLSRGDGEHPGRWEMPVWDLARRIADFGDSGVDVLNLSLGVFTEDMEKPFVLDRAIAHVTPRVVVVAAAGNHGRPDLTDADREAQSLPGPAAVMWPAALDGVVAVGALDGGRPASFTPRTGRQPQRVAPWIDLLAPGVSLHGAFFGADCPQRVRLRRGPDDEVVEEEFSGGAFWSGTSFAAAYVTGSIANRMVGGKSAAEALDEIGQGQDPRIRRP